MNHGSDPTVREPLDDPEFQRLYMETRTYCSQVQMLPDLTIPGSAWDVAKANEWHSILFHLHLAEAIRVHVAEGFNRGAIDGFMEQAELSGDVALLAKGLASKVFLDDPEHMGDAADHQLARAVALLETKRGSVLHRGSAYAMCGMFYHQRQLWPLLGEMNRRAFEEFAAPVPEAFEPMVHRTRIATVANQCVAHAEMACEAYETGFHSEAVDEYLQAPDVTGDMEEYILDRTRYEIKTHRGLLAAVADAEEPAETPSVDDLKASTVNGEIVGTAILIEAVRLMNRGRQQEAARVALDAVDYLGVDTDNVYTLALSFTALQAPVAPMAVHYGRTLARDRRRRRQISVDHARSRRKAEEIILSGRELEAKAYTDSLTGVSNRRAFDEFRTGSLVNPTHPSLGVIVVDVDNFKLVNDVHGHNVGDEVLVEVARTVTSLIRPGDLVYRYGGDEFVVVLTGIPPDRIEARAAMLSRAVAELSWESLSLGLEVTISTGCASGPSERINELVVEADTNMYADKAAVISADKAAVISASE